MDKRVMRERMRRKRRQMMIRRYMRLASYGVAAILCIVFVVRGIIFPIARSFGGKGTGEQVEVQAQTAAADPNAAVRQPLKGAGDIGKITSMTPGWHDDESGRWYQNADGTYYTGGFQEIDGVAYSFDDKGYIQTGWVTKGVKDYYFNDNGSYNPEKKRPMVALTFDDGPGEYTDTLLDCLEQNGAKATFFMQGQHVELYPDEVKRMVELGCELGNHSWSHLNMYEHDYDTVAKQFNDTDEALMRVVGQESTVIRAPYGNADQGIWDLVGKPFFMWSLDSIDWQLKDADLDYDSVMNSEYLEDGAVILMHDIHEASVQAALRIIPDLIAQGYKLVTVSELAEAKNVKLQNTSYTYFTDYALENGLVPGYQGNDMEDEMGGSADSDETLSDGSEDGEYGEEDYSDGSQEDGYSDGSEEDYSDGSEDWGDGSENA